LIRRSRHATLLAAYANIAACRLYGGTPPAISSTYTHHGIRATLINSITPRIPRRLSSAEMALFFTTLFVATTAACQYACFVFHASFQQKASIEYARDKIQDATPYATRFNTQPSTIATYNMDARRAIMPSVFSFRHITMSHNYT